MAINLNWKSSVHQLPFAPWGSSLAHKHQQSLFFHFSCYARVSHFHPEHAPSVKFMPTNSHTLAPHTHWHGGKRFSVTLSLITTSGNVPGHLTHAPWLAESGLVVHSGWRKVGIGALLVHIAQSAATVLHCKGIAIQGHALSMHKHIFRGHRGPPTF